MIYPPRKMLLIYGAHNPKDLIHKISSREDEYNICEMIHLSMGEEKIKEKIDEYPSVILGDIPGQREKSFPEILF